MQTGVSSALSRWLFESILERHDLYRAENTMYDNNAPSIIVLGPSDDESEEWLSTTREPAKDSIEISHGNEMTMMAVFPVPTKPCLLGGTAEDGRKGARVANRL